MQFIDRIRSWILYRYSKYKYPGFYELSPREKEKLDSAKHKTIIPSLLACNNIVEIKGLTVTLPYKEINSETINDVSLPFSLEENRNDPGIWFKISKKDFFNVPGVRMLESHGLDRPLTLTNKRGKKLFIRENSIDKFEANYLKLPQVLTGRILNLSTAPYDELKGYYFRLQIKINDIDITYPTQIIEEENFLKFDNPTWDRQRSFLGIRFLSIKGQFCQIRLNNNTYDFYTIEDLPCQIIDSNRKTDIDSFKRDTLAIRTSFALLSGKFYRTQVFYTASTDPDFKRIDHVYYEREGDSTITNMQLINPNLFFEYFQSQDESFRSKNEKYHKMFPIDTFARLCDEMTNNKTIERTIELILSGNENLNPIQKGAIYSVAIETLANEIYQKNKRKLNPITDKSLSKKIKEELQTIIGNYKSTLGEEAHRILSNKIDLINQPTNRNRLIMPFELYGIKLSESEMKLLEHRNDFLHGNSPN